LIWDDLFDDLVFEILVFDFLLLLLLLVKIINKEIPIKIYKIVQTGPNNQLGGLKKGLFNVEYQLAMLEVVKKEPIKPADKHKSIENIKTAGLGYFMFLISG
jgi:hypothetical protein